MADVTCSRCGSTGPGLERAPFPGPLGESVVAETCAACWREWLGMQVKIINEYRLNPSEAQHFDFLTAQMKAFLQLKES